MIVFLLVVAFIAWFVYLCVTWGKPKKRRRNYDVSAPMPTGVNMTPSDIMLVAVVAQSIANPPHHHCH